MSSAITYLVTEKFLPDTIMPDMRPIVLYAINLRPSFSEKKKVQTNP